MVADVTTFRTNASSAVLCGDRSDSTTNFMPIFPHLPVGENREEAFYSHARLATRDKCSL